MKYNVGDLLLVKECIYKSRPRPRQHPRHCPRLSDYLHPELYNSYGIVTQAIKHSDAWEGQSTNGDNTYVWFSQIDSKEYFFYEDEVIGEVK